MLAWLKTNVHLILGAGVVLVAASTLRCWLVKPHKWLLTTGLVLVVVGVAVLFSVFRGNPGPQDLVDQDPIPPPAPILDTMFQRLQQTWNSEGPPTWPVAETLATLSDIAYLPPVDADAAYRLIGFDNVMPVAAGSMIGYVVSKDEVTVIAFRGTDGKEISDWTANLRQTEFQTAHGPIHQGFYLAYQSLQPQIVTILAKSPPRHLWITGHSLGGALALVCAYDIVEEKRYPVDGLITFGQPMVVKRQLATHLDDVLGGRYARFVNNADVVPRIPPSHVACGSLVWFTGSGIKRSRPTTPVFGSTGEKSVGSPAAADFAEPRPLSEAEFRTLQAEMKAKGAATPRLPEGTPTYAASSPLVDDHSMVLYLEKIRELLGVSIGN